MKISIVTPSFQRVDYLDETIESVLTQKGDFEIEYIIQDGGSGPEILKTLEKWKTRVEQGNFNLSCKHIDFKYFVEKDNGMYDAVNKGFSKTTGDIMAYINTDDMYHRKAFNSVSQIFRKFPEVSWITGIPNSYNYEGGRTGFDSFPAAYSTEFLRRGYYDVKFLDYGFNWLQQESTFWRRELWNKAGGNFNARLKYAADFYLWQEFAKHADLVKVYSFLGGFRVHAKQITSNPNTYRRELQNVTQPPKGLKTMKNILVNFPYLRKMFYNKRKGCPMVNLLGLKWEWLVGRTIFWSYQENKWVLQLRGIL